MGDYVDSCWHNMTGSYFHVRDKDYAELNQKLPSAASLYEVVEIVTYSHESKVLDPTEFLSIPKNPEFPEEFMLPEYIVVNNAVPTYEPSYWYTQDDGPCTMLAFVLKITPEAVQRWVDGSLKEADGLLERFFNKPEPP